MKFLRAIIVMLIFVPCMSAQRTTRTGLKPAGVESKAYGKIEFDTIASAIDSLSLRFSGYEKLLRSSKESFFVTNNTDSVIDRIVVHIDYFDMKMRQLDSRIVQVDLVLPPGETRKADIPSWDKQKTFYYFRSKAPKRGQATPYKVKIKMIAALRRK